MLRTGKNRSIQLIINTFIIFAFFLGGLNFAPNSVAGETQYRPDLNGIIEIKQGPFLHFVVQPTETIQFDLNIKDAGGEYYWEIASPRPIGRASILSKGDHSLVSYQPAPGFTGEDLFTVQVVSSSGASTEIKILMTVNNFPGEADWLQSFQQDALYREIPHQQTETLERKNRFNRLEYANEPTSSENTFESLSLRDTPNPYFSVNLTYNYVYGYDWSANTTVSLSINGILITTQDSSDWGSVNFWGVTIMPGQVITLDDGTFSRTHTVRDIAVTEVNEDYNFVRGYADPNTEVSVSGDDGQTWAWREVTVNYLGEWVADFSDELVFTTGSFGYVYQYDLEGNYTVVYWKIPDPRINVSLINNSVYGNDWPTNSPVSLYIDGIYIIARDSNSWGSVSFWNIAHTILPGQEITLTAGTYSRTHTVRDIAVTEVNEVDNFVHGTADPNTEVAVSGDDGQAWAWREVIANDQGEWVADFSDDLNITSGTYGWVYQYDQEGSSTEIYWFVANPKVRVSLTNNSVNGEGWPSNSFVSLSIDGTSIDTREADNSGWVSFWNLLHAIEPGQLITLDDGIYTRSHIVRDISVTEVNEDINKVYGTAEPNSEVTVEGSDGHTWAWREVSANDQGVWVVDFSGELNLTSGAYGWAYQFDPEGNRTETYWYVPDPMIIVYLNWNQVSGDRWPANTPVSLAINGMYITTRESNNNGWVSFWNIGYSIYPGQEITLTAGTYTRTHTIRDINVTDVNEDDNNVFGTAEPNTEVEVQGDDGQRWAWREVTANEQGEWVADFSGELNLNSSSYGWVNQYDPDGNTTRLRWSVPDPYFYVELINDSIWGYSWPMNSVVTLYVNGNEVATSISTYWGNVSFYNLNLELTAGQVVILSSGRYSREHIVRNLAVTNIDEQADIIYGTADPNTKVDVHGYHGPGAFQQVTANDQGDWVADFSSELNITGGTSGGVYQYDEQGNATMIFWRIPNISVNLAYNDIFGYGWPPNTSITLSIDGTHIGSRISSNWGWVGFWLGRHVIQPGQEVTLTDGTYTRTHVVRDIAVTEVNVDKNLIIGTADPNTKVSVQGYDSQTWAWLEVTANDQGVWQADFSGKLNLSPGTSGWVYQYDPEGNLTENRWYVPDPTIRVWLHQNYIRGQTWSANTTVSLSIDGTHIFSRKTGSWGDVGFFLDPHTIEPGHEVTLSDGIYTRTHIVGDFAVIEINEDDDFVRGTADPLTSVEVSGSNNQAWASRFVTADDEGIWQADFSGVLNIASGTWGSVSQYDDQKNSTWINWFIPDPTLSVNLTHNSIQSYGWPANTPVSLSIDNTYISTQESSRNGWIYIDNLSQSIQPGQEVTLTDGTYIRTHTVRAIAVTEVNQNENLISGTADPNSEVEVNGHNNLTWAWREVTTDSEGIWQADFSGELNIINGVTGSALQKDEQGNHTLIEWYVPDPIVIAYAGSNKISGERWTANTSVSLSVNGIQMATSIANHYGRVDFVDLPLTIEPGQEITLIDTIHSRTHIVRDIAVTDVNEVNNYVSGTAQTDSEVEVTFVRSGEWWVSRFYTKADDSGNWMVDLSGVINLTTGVSGEANQYDPAGNMTSITWEIISLTITSANQASFTAGQLGSFTITTTGFPMPDISLEGNLPAGISFFDNENGTATLSGTPAAGSGGTYPLTITANNGIDPDAVQSFTLTVNEAPAVTSADNTSFTADQQGTFTITATGFPIPALSHEGMLPTGVSLMDNEDGTATLSGTPAAGTGGTYPLTITASNSVDLDAVQSFTLTINEGLAITSTDNTTFTANQQGTFTITTTGFPIPALSHEGVLPVGVSLTDNEDGTATLSGTPEAGTGGTYPLTITASNSIDSDAVQSFTLTVTESLAITSANNTSFTAGQPGTFTITTTGFPIPDISLEGNLPAGVSLTDNVNGTATLSGTPAANTGGTYQLTITASNDVAPDAVQSFTLTVTEGLAITSADNTTFTANQQGTFTITTTGFPVPGISLEGNLPAGVSFSDNMNGNATLSGTPMAGSGGTYPLTITASNSVDPDAVQSFTLIVNEALAITSASSKEFTVGTGGVFQITTTGYPKPSLLFSGDLPAGLTFEDIGSGTAAINGIPSAGSGGIYPLTIIASNSVQQDVTQDFILTVIGFSSCANVSAIPQDECGALASLYSSTNGEDWINNDNWLETDDPGTWFGVTVDGGHVIGLDLMSNNLTGSLEPQFFNLPQLQTLRLKDNQISGPISPAFGGFSNLVYLDMRSNKFSGSIPAEIGQLEQLKGIWLSTNNLDGPIPPALGNLTQLEGLWLGRNKLTGEIPGTLNNITSLTELFLNDNQLTGMIPNALGTMTNLEGLSLRNNQLSGDIPENFENLINLTVLLLDYNRLTVPAVPESLAAFLEEKNPGWDKTQAKTESITTSGGTVTSPDDSTHITVDEDAFEDDIEVTFVPQPEPTQSTGSFGFAGTSFQLTVMSGEEQLSGELVNPIYARIYYNPENLGTIPEDSLILNYWDEAEGVWKDVLDACPEGDNFKYVRDFDEKWFEVPICHLSEFSVLGEIAPTFVNKNEVTFTVGQEKTFIVEAPAYPDPGITIISGHLPSGLNLVDVGNGTATLSGTPAAGSGGTYHITLKAINGIGADELVFTITVREKASITSTNNIIFTEQQINTFMVETAGVPTASILFDGKLPEGISFIDQGNGTAVISGTPAAGSAGTYILTITASNRVGSSPVQSFTLEVIQVEEDVYKIFLPLILQ